MRIDYSLLTHNFFGCALLKSATVWCFLFVTLFNLQGTDRLFAVLPILAYSAQLVKNFFQVFSELFLWIAVVQQLFKDITFSGICQALFQETFQFSLRRAQLSLCNNSMMISYPFSFVKQFFQIPCKLFRSQRLSLASNLIRIPCRVLIVKHFFRKQSSPIWSKAQLFKLCRRSRWQLSKNIRLSLTCQAVSPIFLHFLNISY